MNYLALSIGGNKVVVPNGIANGGITTLQHIIQVFINIFLIIIVVLAVFYIILGGFTWMTSGGEKSKIQTAKLQLTYAIIGLIISFLAFIIIKAVGNFFSIPF